MILWVVMPRKLNQFSGNYAVIGCSISHPRCEGECHSDTNDYYSIDLAEAINPDFVFNITTELPPELSKRFQIIFLENVDWVAYNLPPDDYPAHYPIRNGDKGFKNIWEMTRDDGFIFIKGCPRTKEFRTSLKDLKYIETTADNHPTEIECVIVPKNQNLTIEEFNEQIHRNREVYSLINKLNKTNYVLEPFIYHETDYDCYGSARSPQKVKPDESIAGIIESRKTIPEIKAVYDCLAKLEQFSTTHTAAFVPSISGMNALYCPPVINMYAVFSKMITLSADHFFKNDIQIIQRDIPVFQRKFSELIHSYKTKLSSFLSETQDNSCYTTACAFFGFKKPGIRELIASIETSVIQLGEIEFNVSESMDEAKFFDSEEDNLLSYNIGTFADRLISR